ncbi:PREDICTED: uncharacterized protein LOC101309517 [Fragaria vesca subsp. vesca]|uniref:uncharacterized protein LOC101309517 n=1 Tax=Fragaria vesca subsp. vesca TaxID=101020 RepID=UPI0002C31090|nr:PREDICTED: uncharacterized protein LOC101309517 [Fragaria vesca subsp. vesca]
MKEQKPNPDRRENTGGLLTHIAKFAIDSTINYSLKFKALAGRKQVYEIVQERLKDQIPSTCLDDKKKPQDVKLGTEEMQAKMEKMQEESNIVKLQHQISAKPVKRSDHPKKMPDESIHGSDVPENNRKKIFIRSRL